MHWSVDKSWTLFLDRDGVVNVRLENAYVRNVDEFEFLPGSAEFIAQASKIFGHIFIVTNQQGIGKGLMSESNLLDVHDYMCRSIESLGGKVDKCYFAPQLAEEKSEMRKPGIGMALLAKAEFPQLSFEKSIMVGDSDSDIEFGKKLGMKTVKIDPDLNDDSGADICLSRLNELMNWIQ
jgi:histidinol-phosphate phosphatase family protein